METIKKRTTKGRYDKPYYHTFNKDTFIFKGAKALIGCVNKLDGVIEETHSFKEMLACGGHHSYLFSYNQLEKNRDGESLFFYIVDNKIIPFKYGCLMFTAYSKDNKINDFLDKRIREQITII